MKIKPEVADRLTETAKRIADGFDLSDAVRGVIERELYRVWGLGYESSEKEGLKMTESMKLTGQITLCACCDRPAAVFDPDKNASVCEEHYSRSESFCRQEDGGKNLFILLQMEVHKLVQAEETIRKACYELRALFPYKCGGNYHTR